MTKSPNRPAINSKSKVVELVKLIFFREALNVTSSLLDSPVKLLYCSLGIVIEASISYSPGIMEVKLTTPCDTEYVPLVFVARLVILTIALLKSNLVLKFSEAYVKFSLISSGCIPGVLSFLQEIKGKKRKGIK